MDKLPTEIILRIIFFLYDTKDKIELLRASQYMHCILTSHPGCWTPLDLSLYGDKITSTALLGILRSRSVHIAAPILRQKTVDTSVQTIVNAPSTESAFIDSCPKARQLDSINLSGCHLLNFDALLMLVRSLPHLKILQLNRYAPILTDQHTLHPRHYRRIRSKMVDLLRDDLYQCRPRHGLSSATMDLSRRPLASLSLTETAIATLLCHTRFLTHLSLQHQPIKKTVCDKLSFLLPYLRHLDISSCEISIPDLQLLIRNIAAQLLSLKMLNLEVSNLTLLCLQLHSTSLQCLHLSCLDPQSLPALARLLKSLPNLENFRLTRLRVGSVDELILALSLHRPSRLRSLDMSPKLELYPKFVSAQSKAGLSTLQSPFLSYNSNNSPTSPFSNAHYQTQSELQQHQQRRHSNMPGNPSEQSSLVSPVSSALASSSSSSSSAFASESATRQRQQQLPSTYWPLTSLSLQRQQPIKQPEDQLSSQPSLGGKRIGSLLPSSSSLSSNPLASNIASSGVRFTRSERDLCMSNESMIRIAIHFTGLTELRLCFPTIDAYTLSRFFKTATCPLRILELRLRTVTNAASTETQLSTSSSLLSSSEQPSSVERGHVDYLDGLEYLKQLRTLLIYSVPLTERSVESILKLPALQSLTVHDAKALAKVNPFFLRRWLSESPTLRLIRMDSVPFAWSTVADIVSHPLLKNSQQQKTTRYSVGDPVYDSDSMFVRSCSGKWEWVE